MLSPFIKDKLKIISEPLPSLTVGQRWFLKSFLLSFGQLVITENFDKGTLLADPLIFALNHNCSYESILVPAHLIFQRQGRKISFITDWMYNYIPVIGWILKQVDPICVYNKKSTVKALNRLRPENRPNAVYDECLERLEQGRSIGIFPEGSRNPNSEFLLRGRRGIGYIALHSQVPVLPIGIDFPARLYKGIPKFGPIILRAGAQMLFTEEIALYQQIKLSRHPDPSLNKKTLDYLTSKITFSIMKELSNLSGKKYPFPEPAPPATLEAVSF